MLSLLLKPDIGFRETGAFRNGFTDLFEYRTVVRLRDLIPPKYYRHLPDIGVGQGFPPFIGVIFPISATAINWTNYYLMAFNLYLKVENNGIPIINSYFIGYNTILIYGYIEQVPVF
jgi:hypothetical protein